MYFVFCKYMFCSVPRPWKGRSVYAYGFSQAQPHFVGRAESPSSEQPHLISVYPYGSVHHTSSAMCATSRYRDIFRLNNHRKADRVCSYLVRFCTTPRYPETLGLGTQRMTRWLTRATVEVAFFMAVFFSKRRGSLVPNRRNAIVCFAIWTFLIPSKVTGCHRVALFSLLSKLVFG